MTDAGPGPPGTPKRPPGEPSFILRPAAALGSVMRDLDQWLDREINPVVIDTRRQVGRLLGHLEVSRPRRALLAAGCVLVASVTSYLAGRYSSLGPAPSRALFMLVLAALLWVTEAIPAFAVGILVIGLQVLLLGQPGGVYAETPKDWERFAAILGHPLIWLFFGGFVLAAGTARTGIDRFIATKLLGRFGSSPRFILLGVMAIAFVLSMFMSNTATTAMMLALLVPVVDELDEDDRFARALLLGVAVAANLGGMGSLIGTPPNAIAVGVLEDTPGQQLSFLQWIFVGLPPALLLGSIAWGFLLRVYPSKSGRVDFDWAPHSTTQLQAHPGAPRWQKIVMMVTLLVTMGLWMSGQWHGMPTAAVSFVPIVALTATGVLGAREIRTLSWDVLFLLAGGLALGQTVKDTGLADWLVASLPLSGLGVVGIALVMAYACAAMSNFMSNTAAANVLLPIGATMAAAGFEARVAVPIALGASAAMCLPIATPPNALAFATGRLDTKDFIRLGLVIGLVTPLIAVLWTTLVLDWVLALH
jgi:sodium-dependent dicarboxylate transporter 2/3/5